MKPGRLNVGLDNISHNEIGEEPTNIDDGFPDAHLFWVEITDDHYAPIIQFRAIGVSTMDL